MRDDDAGRVCRAAFQKNGYSGLWIVATTLVATGCGKKGADCEKAVSNLMAVTKADLLKAMPGVDDATVAKMKDAGVGRCKEDKWSDDAVNCLAQASSSAAVQTCQSKMPSEVVQKFSLAILNMNPAPAPTRSPAPADAKVQVEQYIKQHWPGGMRKDETSATGAFWHCDAPTITGVFELATKERTAEVHTQIAIPVKGLSVEAGLDVTLVQAGNDWNCDPKNSRPVPARVGATEAPVLGMDACAAFAEACKPNESAVAPVADAHAGADAGVSDAVAVTPTSGDPIDTTRQVGSLTYTLKKFEIKGKRVMVELLVKNESTEGATLSSVVGFDAINDEGDLGKLDMNGNCDGVVPPGGVLKCRLAYQFPKPQTTVQLQMKDLENSAYFKLAATNKP